MFAFAIVALVVLSISLTYQFVQGEITLESGQLLTKHKISGSKVLGIIFIILVLTGHTI